MIRTCKFTTTGHFLYIVTLISILLHTHKSAILSNESRNCTDRHQPEISDSLCTCATETDTPYVCVRNERWHRDADVGVGTAAIAERDFSSPRPDQYDIYIQNCSVWDYVGRVQ